MSVQTNVAPRAFLTREEFAEMVGVSTATVDRWRRRGVTEPVQVIARGRVRYRVEDVERLLTPELRDPLPVRRDELEWR